MLTKRQIWRRISNSPYMNTSVSEYRSESEEPVFTDISLHEDYKNKIKFPIINVFFSVLSNVVNNLFSLFPEEDETKVNNEERHTRVKFHNSVKVVLIPTKEEYYEANIGDSLWWNPNDFIEFKDSAHSEIIAVVTNVKSCEFRQAMTVLYQPEHKLSDLKVQDFSSFDDLAKIIHLFQ